MVNITDENCDELTDLINISNDDDVEDSENEIGIGIDIGCKLFGVASSQFSLSRCFESC